MNFHWLNKQDSDKLIIFFCGWSFDYRPFENINRKDEDVIVIYDYSDIAFAKDTFKDILGDLKYKSCYLIGWSMGVYVAYLFRDLLPKFEKKIAINGTPFPIDDEFGIPVKTFNLTLKYVDTGLQGKFQKNLFKQANDYEKYLLNPVKRTIENQKTELIALNDYIKNQNITYTGFYDHAIISDTDKIIPTKNQIKCWKNFNTPITIMDSGHFPFFEFDEWKDILTCKQTLKQ